MRHLFLPYPLAKLAADSLFNDKCLYDLNLKDELVPKEKESNYNYGELILAPLYQQIIDWLRIKHNIEVFVIANDKGLFWYGVSYIGDENGTIDDSSENPSNDWYFEMNTGIEFALKYIR